VNVHACDHKTNGVFDAACPCCINGLKPDAFERNHAVWMPPLLGDELDNPDAEVDD
jgi:hypothetical protein